MRGIRDLKGYEESSKFIEFSSTNVLNGEHEMLNFNLCFTDIRYNLEILPADKLDNIETVLNKLDHAEIQSYALKFAGLGERNKKPKQISQKLDIIAARIAQCIAIYCQED